MRGFLEFYFGRDSYGEEDERVGEKEDRIRIIGGYSYYRRGGDFIADFG